MRRGSQSTSQCELDHSTNKGHSQDAANLYYLLYLYRPSKLQCFGKINRFLDETT